MKKIIAHKELWPRLSETLTNDTENAEYTAPEECSSTTKEVIERISKPTANQTGSNVRPVP